MFVGEGVAIILFSSICMSFQTGEVRVRPVKYEIEPGSRVSFICETSLDISQFRWELNGNVVSDRFVMKLSDHSMKFWLNTAEVSETVRHELDVLCISKDGRFIASSTVYFGYVPLAPKIECMLQNLDTIHCRWNRCDPRTKEYPERSHPSKYYVSYHTMHYGKEENKHKNCSVVYDQSSSDDCQTPGNGTMAAHRENCSSFASSLTAECYSFCSATENSGWEYWNGIEIRLEAANIIGRNISKISFTPRQNVVLTPPSLDVQNVTNGDEESAAVVITAHFSSTVKGDHFFLEYCEQEIVLEIRYKRVSNRFDRTTLQENSEEKFWSDWSRNRVPTPTFNEDFMANAQTMIALKRQVTLPQLQANATFLLQAKWKYNGTSCNGIWGYASHSIFKTRVLKPPAFLQAAMLYFDDRILSNFSHEIYDMNGSSTILWRHTKESYQMYQSNEFYYRLSSIDDKCFSPLVAPKSSYSFLFHENELDAYCWLKISALNQLGNSSAAYLLAKPSKDSDCSPQILSMKKVYMHRNLVRFKVDWTFISQNASIICSEYSEEENITISLFFWEERCPDCRQKVDPRDSPSHFNGRVRSFYADVRSSHSYKERKHFPVGFLTKDLSSSVRFSYPFRVATAYSIAATLSTFDGETLVQSPAYLAKELYYHGVGKPLGIPSDIICKDIDDSSMTLKWSSLPPQMRGGPILGYIIYITETKRCFSEESGTACGSPYEKCDSGLVRSKTVSITTQEVENFTFGWVSEATSSNREMSHRIDNLQSGTHHYIGIVAFNDAGTGKCFGYVTQATKAERDTTIILVAAVFLFIAVALLGLFFSLVLRRRIMRWIRRPVPQPVISISMGSEHKNSNRRFEENMGKVDISYEYADLCDEVKPLKGEAGENNNYPEKIFFYRKDNSPHPDKNSVGPYLRNANPPPTPCDNKGDSSSTDTPCCSTSTGNESSPSSHCEYSGDGMSSDEEDTTIYTSTETALIIGRNRRRFLL